MQSSEPIEPTKALDDFFAVVREQAIRNPSFGASLLEALKVQVIYQGDAAAEVIDPVALVRLGQEEFRKTFLSFDDKQLKKFLKDFSLASQTEFGRLKGPALVELLWERASTKYHDLFGR
jgi:hypothetical protein